MNRKRAEATVVAIRELVSSSNYSSDKPETFCVCRHREGDHQEDFCDDDKCDCRSFKMDVTR